MSQFHKRALSGLPRAPRFRCFGNGTWCYNFYRVGRRQTPRKFLPDRILPRPLHQGHHGSCLSHAAVQCLEAVLRKKRGSIRGTWRTPRLSIQQCIDRMNGRTDLHTCFTELEDFGVTSNRVYPYRRGGEPETYEEPAGKHYAIKISHPFFDEEYKGTDKEFIMGQIQWLKIVGPFIGEFDAREDHLKKGLTLNKEDRLTIESPVVYKDGEFEGQKVPKYPHAVVIVGYKVKNSKVQVGRKRKRGERSIEGYWIFMDSYGPGLKGHGFGTMDFDVLNGVINIEAESKALPLR